MASGCLNPSSWLVMARRSYAPSVWWWEGVLMPLQFNGGKGSLGPFNLNISFCKWLSLPFVQFSSSNSLTVCIQGLSRLLVQVRGKKGLMVRVVVSLSERCSWSMGVIYQGPAWHREWLFYNMQQEELNEGKGVSNTHMGLVLTAWKVMWLPLTRRCSKEFLHNRNCRGDRDCHYLYEHKKESERAKTSSDTTCQSNKENFKPSLAVDWSPTCTAVFQVLTTSFKSGCKVLTNQLLGFHTAWALVLIICTWAQPPITDLVADWPVLHIRFFEHCYKKNYITWSFERK